MLAERSKLLRSKTFNSSSAVLLFCAMTRRACAGARPHIRTGTPVLLRAEDIGVRFALRSGLFGARRTFKAVEGEGLRVHEPTIGRQERDKRACWRTRSPPRPRSPASLSAGIVRRAAPAGRDRPGD